MRPKRLYKTKRGRYYYLRNGKRVYIRRKKGAPKISQKQLVKISIKNIIGDTSRRVKRRRKRKKLSYTKKIVDEQRQVKTGLPVYLFEPKKIVPSLTERVSSKAKQESTSSYDNLLKEIENIKKLVSIPDSEKETKVPKTIIQPEPPKKKTTPTPTPPTSPLRKRLIDPSKKPEVKDFRKEFEKWLINNYKYSEFVEKKVPERKKKIDGYMKRGRKMDMLLDSIEDDYNDDETYDDDNEMWEGILDEFRSEDIENVIDMIEEKIGENEMSGWGREKGEGGLFDSEIDKINEKVFNSTIPVIAKNELEQLDQYVKPNMDKFGFIINTDPTPQPAESNGHWRAIYINNCDDYQTIEYFDPLVSTPEKALIDKLRKIAKKINPEQFFLFKINNLITQPDESDNCGYHCILFLEKRFHNVPWSEATYYNDYMNKTKPDHTDKGESEVLKAKRKYKTYL